MKKQIIILSAATLVLLSSCSTIVDLGKLNMISDRNVDSKADYVLLKSYAGGSKKEAKKAEAEEILTVEVQPVSRKFLSEPIIASGVLSSKSEMKLTAFFTFNFKYS